MIEVLTCITREHDLRLVALSACICALGCFTTVTLMARAEEVSRGGALKWLVSAALVLGSSVWSLHFVAMLAFMPSVPIAYDPDLTVISIAISIAGSLAAMMAWRFLASRWWAVWLSGTALGLGVAGMHYTGVAAMRLGGMILIDKRFMAVSLLASFGFATMAMLRANRLSGLGRRLEIAGWMAICICGLHFVGMTAVSIAPGPATEDSSALIGSSGVAFGVGLVSLGILLASLAATLMQQHLSLRTVQELARMRLLSNLSREGLVILRNGVVIEVNDAGLRLTGKSAETILGQPLFELFAEDEKATLIRRERGGPKLRQPEEYNVITIAGLRVPVEMSCQEIEFQGRPATAIALRDLTDRKRDEARIRHLAHHDALTDLPNRFLLEERLNRALDKAAHESGQVGVIYLDLDRFKPINDLLGHAAGENLLVQASKRILAELRPSDTLARLGGDEFAVVMLDVQNADRISAVVSKVIDSLKRPFEIENQRIEISASAGIAIFPSDGATVDTLLRAADTAMYRVKEGGRGAFRFFEASMDSQIRAKQLLEMELSQAADLGQLVLFYQPIVNVITADVETFEALMRWDHPVRGVVPPWVFIPIAEQTDLIAKMGVIALEQACAEAVRWPKPWRVSVNVSPAQFRFSDLPKVVAKALAESGLAPERLMLEITETIFIDNAVQAVATLQALRRLGVSLALDDFGTGYSSLSYLQLFKFDRLKIDRSFVQNLEHGDEAYTIIKAIVTLGQNLGLAVTVEGIETARHMALLHRLGCHSFQGYLFGRPLPVPAVSELELARLGSLNDIGYGTVA